jgi:DNA polymerase delta subunit 3
MTNVRKVTREESSWESFSEEEKASTAKSKPSMPSSQGKKGGNKAQGNIMSFFGRK